MEILHIILNWLIPCVCATLVALVSKQLKYIKTIKDSQVILLRSQIVGKVEQYMGQGYLPDYARSCIERFIYRIYYIRRKSWCRKIGRANL